MGQISLPACALLLLLIRLIPVLGTLRCSPPYWYIPASDGDYLPLSFARTLKRRLCEGLRQNIALSGEKKSLGRWNERLGHCGWVRRRDGGTEPEAVCSERSSRGWRNGTSVLLLFKAGRSSLRPYNGPLFCEDFHTELRTHGGIH